MTEEQALPRRPGVGARRLGGETHGAVLDGLHPPVAVDAGADGGAEGRNGVREGLEDLREVAQDAPLPAALADQDVDARGAAVGGAADAAVQDEAVLRRVDGDDLDVRGQRLPDDRSGGRLVQGHRAAVQCHAGLLLLHGNPSTLALLPLRAGLLKII